MEREKKDAYIGQLEDANSNLEGQNADLIDELETLKS